MNITIITHKNCSDGAVSAALLSLYYESDVLSVDISHNVKVVEFQYNEPTEFINNISNQDIVYLTDISLPTYSLYTQLCLTNKRVISLDHHKTMMDNLILSNCDVFKHSNCGEYNCFKSNDNPNLTMYFPISDNLSGASLTLSYIKDTHGFVFGHDIEQTVYHVARRDLWKFDTDTKSFTSTMMYLVGTNVQSYLSIFKLWHISHGFNRPCDAIICNGNLLELKMKKFCEYQVGQYSTEPTTIELNGKVGNISFLIKEDTSKIRHLSETASLLLDSNPTVDVVGVVYYPNTHSDLVVSFRSRMGSELTAIDLATNNGGGGHISAAGCTIDGLTLDSFKRHDILDYII